MSIIANGGGMPPSQARVDAYYEARRVEAEQRREYVASMRERGYHFEFRSNAPDLVWCLTCGLMVGDVDLHDAAPCKTAVVLGSRTDRAADAPLSTPTAQQGTDTGGPQ